MACKRLHLLAFLLPLFVIPLAAVAQTDRGTITGTVSDPTGAVIASADVVATQVTTGVQFKTVANNLGFYSLLDLPIGSYNVSFRKAGFVDMERTGIDLETQHTVEVDAMMRVGAATETVTVSGAAPVLELQNEVGTNMNAQEMTDLPLSIVGGRDMTSFAYAVTPNVSGNNWTSYISGSQAFTTGTYIDGTSTDSGIVGDLGEEEPSMDAIQESQTDTAGLSAADGRTGGGAMNFELKSGSNRFHGTSFGFLDNEFLNANDWTDNWYLSQCAAGDTACVDEYRRAYYRYFDYGVSGGGPIWKKWLGIKKMYIYAAYEKYLQANWQQSPTNGTVPTTDMLAGNFSELLPAAAAANGCSVSPCPIMNGTTPYTDSAGNTIYYGSIFSPRGTVYPDNIITDPLSPIAQKIASYYQSYKPTVAGVTNNYPSLANEEPWFHQTQLSFKYDWSVGANDHIAASYIYTLRPRYCTGACGNATNSVLWQSGSTTGGPLSDGSVETVIGGQYRANETHIFSPNLLNDVAYTFNTFDNKSIPMTSIAGSTNWPQQVGYGSIDPLKNFPYITFTGSPDGIGETSIGSTYTGGYDAYNAIVNDTLSWTKGRHTMKFGAEYRELGFNLDNTGGALSFNFSNNTFAPTNTSIQPYVGSAFANFLLGEVQNASQALTFNLNSRRKEISFFGQDDIRINRRFLVSGSLRWELTRPLHVLGGKWSNWSISAPNQVYGGIPGAYTWLSNPNGSFETYTDWHQLAPKIGGSYEITDKLVARASAGINFVPLGWNGYSGTPYGSAVGYTGLNQVVEVSAQAPAFQWDAQNYPGVYTPPTGPAPTNAALQATWGPANVNPNTRQLAFTESWFAGLQYEMPGHAVVEVSYLGSSGRNLHDGALNPLNFPTWSTYQPLINSGNEWDWVYDQGSAAAAGVPYPYPGFAGEAYFAIFPFPQVQADYAGGTFFTNSPLGQSGYNAFTVEGKKQRGSLNLDLSYNLSRTTGNTGSAFIDTWSFNYWYQDPYNYKHESTYAQAYDTVKGYSTYVLPFGLGRRFLSGSGKFVNDLVAGWEGGAIVYYANAGPMGAVGSTNYYPGWSAVYTNVTPGASFKNTFKKYNPSWNPTVAGAAPDPDSLFVNPANFSNPTYGELGNSPTSFCGCHGYPNWRGWSTPQESASLLKKTPFGADNRYTFTLRAEFFDLFNRHYWDNPNTNLSSAYFGHVTGAYGNRTGQLGARFEW
ncbi:MAG TPA: carboxypeptidase-like regulatory domain-containing protein [Terracidiphilus sp.]|nr:carboxypeptidase-like regulatory domain-containing protein [Terracidiphilus sp.]